MPSNDSSLPAPFFPVERARKIRLLALDVDGVLTDGGLFLLDNETEAKRFHVRDGLGIRLLGKTGIVVGLITARRSPLVERRARELELAFVHQGAKNKWQALQPEISRLGLQAEQCAYMGDDLVDLDLLSRVGLATTPADGHPEVQSRVHWVATHPGGWGAVRELAENLIKAQGHWQTTLAGLLPDSTADGCHP